MKLNLLKSHTEETLHVVNDHLDKFDSIQEYSVKNIKEWHHSCGDMLIQDFNSLKGTFSELDASVCSFDKIIVAHLEAEEKIVGLYEFFSINFSLGYKFWRRFRGTHREHESKLGSMSHQFTR